MSPESVQTPEPSPAGMGEFARITGVFFEPAKTFQDIAERPRWIVPALLVIVVSLVYMGLYSQHVGWERMFRHQMELSSRAAQMSPADQEKLIAQQTKIGPIFAYVAAVVGPPIYYTVCAAVLLAIVAGMMSASVRGPLVPCGEALSQRIKDALARFDKRSS